MRYLGIDFGSKRIGIALSDEGGKFAMPKAVYPNDKYLVSKILDFINHNNVDSVVIGESKDYNGQDNPIMKKIAKFKAELENTSKRPAYLEPEFMTSAEAERVQGKNKMTDASAAAIILQSYLDKNSKH